jgi:hypothetical protein
VVGIKNKTMEHIVLKKGVSVTSIDSEDLISIYKGIEFIIKNKYQHSILHGLSFEIDQEEFEWIATSIEMEKWHCHGIGDTPENAIKDMVEQINKNNEKKEKNTST